MPTESATRLTRGTPCVTPHSHPGLRLRAASSDFADAALRHLQSCKPAPRVSPLLFSPLTLESAGRTHVAVRLRRWPSASAIQSLPVGAWQGPARSESGLHLVPATARAPGRKATPQRPARRLEAGRVACDAVKKWAMANDQQLRAKYRVNFEGADDGVGDRRRQMKCAAAPLVLPTGAGCAGP